MEGVVRTIRLLFTQRSGLGSFNVTRANAVTLDVVRTELGADVTGQHLQTTLCSCIATNGLTTKLGHHGADVDDLALVLLNHAGQDSLGDDEGRIQVNIDDHTEVSGGHTQLFKPLTGRYQELYAQLLLLIWDPGYVYIKGDWEIVCQGHLLSVRMFHGGIALSSDALTEIDHISVPGKRIISVENLTTYHDTQEHQGAVIYLGGFLNTVRTNLLKKVFASEPHAQYYHHGDLDPYGFLILEDLKAKTGIPFEPLEMDLPTLRRCHLAGHFRPLDESD